MYSPHLADIISGLFDLDTGNCGGVGVAWRPTQHTGRHEVHNNRSHVLLTAWQAMHPASAYCPSGEGSACSLVVEMSSPLSVPKISPEATMPSLRRCVASRVPFWERIELGKCGLESSKLKKASPSRPSRDEAVTGGKVALSVYKTMTSGW